MTMTMTFQVVDLPIVFVYCPMIPIQTLTLFNHKAVHVCTRDMLTKCQKIVQQIFKLSNFHPIFEINMRNALNQVQTCLLLF